MNSQNPISSTGRSPQAPQVNPPATQESAATEPKTATELPEISEGGRDPLELLATQFLEESRQGKRPRVEEYAARYPRLAGELRELLSTLLALEEMKSRQELASVRQPLPEHWNITRLGEFRVLREIGRGGMGVVFEGIHEKINRRVAIKLLPWRFPRQSRWRRQFLREAQLAAQLKHPHIVPVFSYGEEDGRCYYVMQLIEGVGLDRLIQRLRQGRGIVAVDEIHSEFRQHGQKGGIPAQTAGLSNRVLRRGAWHQFAKIGAQVASALRYAHQQGTLHRDIKPGNVMLDVKGALWITDFGLAMAKEHAMSGQEVVAGTIRYMAPEQFEGMVDERSDIYSFGVTLYELCTLVPAFSMSTRMQLIQGIRAGERRPPMEIVPTMPRRLNAIITKCMAISPAERYQSVDEVLEDLTRFLAGQPLRGESRPPFWKRWWKRD